MFARISHPEPTAPKRRSSDDGEVASWLILAAGLALAAAAAVGFLKPMIVELANRVGVAAESGVVASTGAPGDGSPGSGAPGDGSPSSGSPGSGAPGSGAPGDGSPTLPAPSPSVRADEVLQDVQDTLNAGDDLAVSNGELNDIADWLATLSDEELNYVFANLTGDQLHRLFHNAHSQGRLSNDWDDGERSDFYDTLSGLTQENKDRITGDATLMALLEDSLNTDQYLDVLVALATDHSNGAFPSATDADALIRQFIDADYLDGPIANGAQAEGNLAIVDDHNFMLAWQALVPGSDRWMTLNGFVDDDGRQWVRASAANAGTPVHEAIHNYSESDLNSFSNQFNEGVTEYFTRQVVANTDDPATATDEAQNTLDDRAGIYDPNERFVRALVAVAGEDALADAYFDGDIDSLRDAYIDATGRTEDDWETMMDLVDRSPVSADDWNDATDLLDPVTP